MRNRLNEMREQLRDKLRADIDYSREISDEEMQELIDGLLMREGKKQPMLLEERAWLRKELFYAVRKLDVLQELIDNTDITEIMINGPDYIFVEKKGRLSRLEQKFESREKLEDIIQQIVAACNRVVNEASPIVDARLENGARVNVVLSPVALNGPIVTIRRFPDKPIMMKDLVSFGSVPLEVCEWLQKLVKARYN
ncbi:MAG: Flp pilus assembly complex ATPase component TadA, partial [Lachnospiraceae bacterium]|nr:Flp pilus assembly complex ATPase component TadA [Lachnospiraceae bacterium]